MSDDRVIIMRNKAVKRKVGFINLDSLGPIQIPYFLKSRNPDHADSQGNLWYTYVPSKPYNQQPYYYMSEDSVVKNSETNKPFSKSDIIALTCDFVKDALGPTPLLFFL